MPTQYITQYGYNFPTVEFSQVIYSF